MLHKYDVSNVYANYRNDVSLSLIAQNPRCLASQASWIISAYARGHTSMSPPGLSPRTHKPRNPLTMGCFAPLAMTERPHHSSTARLRALWCALMPLAPCQIFERKIFFENFILLGPIPPPPHNGQRNKDQGPRVKDFFSEPSRQKRTNSPQTACGVVVVVGVVDDEASGRTA